MTELAGKLAAPFPAADVEWRVARSGLKGEKPWAMCLAYITNRAIMERLDATVGPENWRNEFQRWGDKGVLCGISIRSGTEWVTKWDGAEETDIESVKGGLSAAMKRAAVQWGIGRYLYGLEEGWALFSDKGPYSAKIEGKFYHWSPPELPAWALPKRAAGPLADTIAKQSFSEKPAALAEPEPALPAVATWKGKPLKDKPSDELVELRKWCVKTDPVKWATKVEEIDTELAGRVGE